MATATLVIATIGTQAANTPFSVTGTYQLNSGTWQEQLEYDDDSAPTQTPIAAAATTTTTSSFTFTHPGLAAGTHTVSIKDPLTGTVVTSNSFTVSAARAIEPATPTGVVTGASWTFSGTLVGYSAAPVLTYRLDGGAATSVTGVTSSGWSMSMAGLTAGSHSIVVSDGTITSSTISFTVAAVTKTITPNVPTNVVAGAVFTFTGTLSGYSVAPSMTYFFDNGGNYLPMTGVTQNGWSMALTAPNTPGTHSISVSDGTTTVAVQFAVSAPAKSLTAYAPASPVAGSTFTFTGVLNNFSTIPALTYSLDGGAAVAMTGVTVTGWAMSITAPAVGTHTLVVTDAADTLSSSVSFSTTAASGLVPVTWDAATATGGVTLSNGNYTATSTGLTTPYGAKQYILATTAIAQNLAAGTVVAWEIDATTLTQNWNVGLAQAGYSQAGGSLGGDAVSIGAYPSTGTGSQPAQAVYFNNAQLAQGSAASANGEVITIAVNGSNFFFSDATMRATTGVTWNNSTTADPVKNVGGFTFTFAAPYFPAFSEGEGGGVAVLADGSSAFSSFLQAYITANPGKVVSLAAMSVPTAKTISPVTPQGLIMGAAFNFSGTLTGYASAPTLTYQLDGGSPAPLTGVTATGWSMTLTIPTTGSHTIVVTDGTVSGSTTFTVSATGGVNRVVAPLTGTVTPGTWVQNQRLTVTAMPNKFMAYDYLLPANYSSGVVYPVIVYGHENDEGMNGGSYPATSLSTNGGEVAPGISIDAVYNTVAFRTNFPCIVIVPYCDQTIDTSGANGNANFGGYADTPNSGGNEQGILALVNHFISSFAVDTTRIYADGNSLGAIGALAWLVDNNAYNGINKVFAAGIGRSDQLYRPNVNGGSNTAAFASMKNVPYCAISTPYDNSASIYDQAGWQYYTGNTNYPSEATFASGGMAAIQAAGTSFYYIEMTSSTMPWQTYNQLNADGGLATPIYNWLFSQIAGSAGAAIDITGVTATSTQAAPTSVAGATVGSLSPASSGGTLNNTAVNYVSEYYYQPSVNNQIATTTAQGIVDAGGNLWQINTAGAKVVSNGVVYQVSGNQTELAYVGGVVWALNTSGQWYSFAGSGSNVTTASGPQTTSPLTGTGVPAPAPVASTAFTLSGNTLLVGAANPAAGAYVINVQVVAGNAVNSPQTYPVSVSVSASASNNFRVSGGILYDPSGAVWKGRGINIFDADMGTAVTGPNGAGPLLTLFPNLNIVRVACYSYNPPSYYQSFITSLTAKNIVVLLEDHTSSDGQNRGGGTGVVYTGTLLANELAWYSALASAFASNPYVWFATDNEPTVSPSVAALSTWHQQTYNAIRNAGNGNIMLIDVNNSYTWGTNGGMTASVYAAMTNVMWDMHCYDWEWSDPGSTSGYSSNLTTIRAGIASYISLLQQLTSADGIIPVISGEYGNSTTGSGVDAGGAQNCQAVQESVTTTGGLVGCMAWVINGYNAGNLSDLSDNIGSWTTLSTYGQEIAAWIASVT